MVRSVNFRVAWAAALAISLGCLPAAAAADQADDVRKANEELAKHGWVVDSLRVQGTDQEGIRHLIAHGRVRLPVDAAWDAMANENEEDWPGLNDVVREYANGDTLISRYKLGIPVYADRSYRLRIINDHPARTMNFEQIPGYGNVKEIRGYWSAAPLSDSLSTLTYCLYTDPGVRWIPGFIVNWATKREIPHLFAHIYESGKKRMEESVAGRGQNGNRSTDFIEVQQR